jgi:WD40 repeat protein
VIDALTLDKGPNPTKNISLARVRSQSVAAGGALLCVCAVREDLLAIGAKDGAIYLVRSSGALVGVLKGHRAAICCVCTTVFEGRRCLVSGADEGCGTVRVWSIEGLRELAVFSLHSAAVTCLADLRDSEFIFSGSFDKSIGIHSLLKNETISSVNHKSSSVACMVVDRDCKRLFTAGLNNMLLIWAISRRPGAIDLQLSQTISEPSMVCAAVALQLKEDWVLCGTKEGKLKVVDLARGSVVSSLAVNSNAIGELLVLERRDRPANPQVISCPLKEQNLILTRLGDGHSEILDVQERLAINFGCGVGPVMCMLDQGQDLRLVFISQLEDRREFYVADLT